MRKHLIFIATILLSFSLSAQDKIYRFKVIKECMSLNVVGAKCDFIPVKNMVIVHNMAKSEFKLFTSKVQSFLWTDAKEIKISAEDSKKIMGIIEYLTVDDSGEKVTIKIMTFTPEFTRDYFASIMIQYNEVTFTYLVQEA